MGARRSRRPGSGRSVGRRFGDLEAAVKAIEHFVVPAVEFPDLEEVGLLAELAALEPGADRRSVHLVPPFGIEVVGHTRSPGISPVAADAAAKPVAIHPTA